MLLTRTVAPSETIIALADVKEHLRVTESDEDFYISGLISVAGAVLAEMTGRSILSETWEMAQNGVTGKVSLPKVPVQSVASITYYDRDNAAQTATVADFYLFKDEDRAWLEPKPGFTWPATYDREDALTITFVAGYTVVPLALKHAAMMLVAHWYERREAAGEAVQEVPFAVQSLVGLHRLKWIAS